MEANNMEAMRKALKLCGSQMCKLCKDLTLARSMINKGLIGVSCHPDKCKPYQAAHSALALPLRQCDVGTTEEQFARFAEFCHANVDISGNCRATCPFTRLGNCRDRAECYSRWAQLPYESEEAK